MELSEIKNLVVARSIVLNEEGEILLVKRSSTVKHNPEKWQLPGGVILNGESIQEAIERLIFSETNLIVRTIRNKYYVGDRHNSEPGKYQGFNYYEIALTAKYISGNARIKGEEHTDIQWILPEKALDEDISIESRKILMQYIEDSISQKELEEQANKFIIAARALIKNNEGKYLLVQRSSTSSYCPGQWEIPGGKLDQFESLPEHLIREVLEEIGIVITIVKPAIFIHSSISKSGKHKGKTMLTIITEASIGEGKIKLSNEHDNYAWVTPDEVLNYDLVFYLIEPLTKILG